MEIYIYYTFSWEKQEHILKKPCAERDSWAMLTLCNTEASEAVFAKLSRDDPAQQGCQPARQHIVKEKEKKNMLFEQVMWIQSMVPVAETGMLYVDSLKT